MPNKHTHIHFNSPITINELNAQTHTQSKKKTWPVYRKFLRKVAKMTHYQNAFHVQHAVKVTFVVDICKDTWEVSSSKQQQFNHTNISKKTNFWKSFLVHVYCLLLERETKKIHFGRVQLSFLKLSYIFREWWGIMKVKRDAKADW